MKRAFDMIDEDRSGLIDAEELQGAAVALGIPMEENIAVLLGTDKVNFEEFFKRMTAKLSPEDTADDILNIFEPRYRQMYSDILFNGSRRFAVPVSNPETGRLANVAPVFYLEDLKEVSEQTDDAVKYVCSHKVIGRVRIDRTLNDKVWSDRTTYLKAVVEPLEDGDDDEDLSTREGSLTDRFTSIIENQTKLQEPVRFTESLTSSLSAERGEDGLWRMAGLWQSLMQNRLGAKESELSDEIQKLLRQYLESQGQDMRSKDRKSVV